MLRISIGGWFELYDLFMTAYISLGLIRDGLFVATTSSPFSLNGFAGFIACGFAGMYVGTIFFSWIADRAGRKTAFVYSLAWYSAATIAMALSRSAPAIDLWRFIAGIGIGVQLITIDSYISEVVPKNERGYWIAFSQFIGYLAIPAVALAAYLLVPREFLGLSGWRFVALIGSLGGIAVWFLQRGLPESPRWSRERHGNATLGFLTTWAYLWNREFRRRTIMLVIFNFAQTIGFYGFTAWVPIFVASQGVGFARSLQYSFIIAVVNPLGPLLAMRLADRWQRKWQIVVTACIIAVFGLLFSRARAPAMIVAIGIIVTLATSWFSCVFHAYQAELYPTGVRAQAVGFVYSWSRFSSIFVGFLIAAVLRDLGTTAVFSVIALAMAVVALAIGAMGVRTNNLELEEIAQIAGRSGEKPLQQGGMVV